MSFIGTAGLVLLVVDSGDGAGVRLPLVTVLTKVAVPLRFLEQTVRPMVAGLLRLRLRLGTLLKVVHQPLSLIEMGLRTRALGRTGITSPANEILVLKKSSTERQTLPRFSTLGSTSKSMMTSPSKQLERTFPNPSLSSKPLLLTPCCSKISALPGIPLLRLSKSILSLLLPEVGI